MYFGLLTVAVAVAVAVIVAYELLLVYRAFYDFGCVYLILTTKFLHFCCFIFYLFHFGLR